VRESFISGLESVEGAILESGLERGGRLTERVKSRDTFLERTESERELSNCSNKKKERKRVICLQT
jgi:hypothetical protein